MRKRLASLVVVVVVAGLCHGNRSRVEQPCFPGLFRLVSVKIPYIFAIRRYVWCLKISDSIRERLRIRYLLVVLTTPKGIRLSSVSYAAVAAMRRPSRRLKSARKKRPAQDGPEK